MVVCCFKMDFFYVQIWKMYVFSETFTRQAQIIMTFFNIVDKKEIHSVLHGHQERYRGFYKLVCILSSLVDASNT